MTVTQKILFCFLFFSASILYGQSQVKYKEGLFSQRLVIYDKLSSKDSAKITYDTNDKGWFRNNTLIEQVGTAPSFKYDVFQENRLKNIRYVFKSLRDSSVYEYASMTDTATCLGVYKLFSDIELSTGSPVYRGLLWITSVNGPFKLADTTIDNVSYTRFINETDTAGLHLMNTYYLQCDYPDILSLAPWHNKIFDCPTMIQISSNVEFTPNGGGSIGVLKNTLVRDSLTEEEIKVFDAWEKYARENPFSKQPKKATIKPSKKHHRKRNK